LDGLEWKEVVNSMPVLRQVLHGLAYLLALMLDLMDSMLGWCQVLRST
jgi:hypothetical protein